jgi:hypothetical protein
MKNVVSSLAALSILAFAGLATAQPDPASRAVAKTVEADKDAYGYIFEDDALNALDNDGNLPIIKARPRGLRTNLIRPRTSFVPELFKSVEKL